MAIQVPRNDFDPRILFRGNDKDDKSPYAQTGTLVAGATIGVYLTLNGTNQYLTYLDVASNSLFSANQITFGAWINFDTLDGTDQIIISKWDEGNNNRNFTLKVDATADTITSIISSDGSASSSSISTTETVTAGTDAFIVVTWDGTQHKIFLNGVEVKSAQYSSGIFDSNELVALGADFSTTAQKFMDGTIYQAFVLGIALSAQQISNLNLHPRGKDFHMSLPKKQLLFYEDFTAGGIPKGWNVVSGQFAVRYDNTLGEWYLDCVSAGVIGIPIPFIMQDMALAGLDFEWDMLKDGAASTSNASIIAATIAAAPTGYRYVFGSDESVALNEVGVGDLGASAASEITIDTWHACRVTRSAGGEFSFYLDGTLVTVTSGSNPVTDTTTTTTRFLVFDLDVGDRVKNIRIKRF